MVSRWMLRLFGMTAAVICLCITLFPLQTINAESVCYIEGCPGGQPPVITDQPDDVTISVGGTATFSVSATNALDYYWYQGIVGDERRLVGSTSSFTTGPLNLSTQYWVRVGNYDGYTDSHAVAAQIDPVGSPFPFCTSQQLAYDRALIPQTNGRFITWLTQFENTWPWLDETTDLYIHDALTDTTQLMTEVGDQYMTPRISNNRIVWNGQHLIGNLMNLLTGELTNLSEIIDLSGNRLYLVEDYVVWQNYNYIRKYDLISGTTSEFVPEGFDLGPIIAINNRYAIIFSYMDNQFYVYNLALNTLQSFNARISDWGYPSPDIPSFVMELDGSYFVWQDGESYDIYLLDLTTMEQLNISNSPDQWDDVPDLDNGKVVWRSSNNGSYDNSRVLLYDAQTRVKSRLTPADGRFYDLPKIDGNRIVWQSTGSEAHLHVLDLETQNEQVVPLTVPAWDLQISDRWVALITSPNESVYLYDGIAVHQIASSNASLNYMHLQLVGSTILWRAHPQNFQDMSYYGYKFIFISKCEGAAPTITDQPDNMLISTGESVTLSVTASGDGSIAYQWYQGTSGDTSNPISGATSSSYTTPPLTTMTTYWVRVNGTFGSVDSNTAFIVNRDEWTPTWTPVPETATDTPTETATATPTWTTVPDTETPMPSATWTDVPPTQVTVPTATTAPTVSLLINGGFEVDGDSDKIPDGWTAKKTSSDKADKLKCDKDDKVVAHTAPCAFLFNGNPDGSTSSLSQKVSDTSALIDGATVTLSAWIDPKSAPVGTKFAQAKITYSDGSSTKLKLSVPQADGYVQQADATTLDLTVKSIKSVKVDVKYDQPNGKFYVDDVALTVEAGTALFRLP